MGSMSSNDGDDPPDDTFFPFKLTPITAITTNPPWPLRGMDPVKQTIIERLYFEDGATIHFERMSPMAFRDYSRVNFVARRVIGTARQAQRRLTASEVDAAAEHADSAARYFAWIEPCTAIGALVLAVRGRRTFQFPFYIPQPKKFYPFTFPMRRFAFLEGDRAAAAWHITRFLSYLPFFWAGTAFLFGSIAQTTWEMHILRDPRLLNVTRDIERNMRNERARVMHQITQRGFPERPGMGNPQSPPEVPPPSQFPRDQYTSESENQAAQGYGSETSASQAEDTPSSPAAQPHRGATASTPQSQAQPSKPQDDDSDLFDDDDASPVPHSLRRAEAEQASSSQRGSTWDRIRQKSQSGEAQWARGDSSGQERSWGQLRQDKTQNSRDSQPKTEGYSYSKQDEDREKRNYEKDQAQKEFDALLEAERRGGSNKK
ncbi:hypothetical protein F4677DRAFT_425924 [Hypoxylon crocopeplum]|nr:hypothetical protein F4677DRAFT_425924 [Hypoxylon crocopeplum]